MRKRTEVEYDVEYGTSETMAGVQAEISGLELEVLLDCRDILCEIRDELKAKH